MKFHFKNVVIASCSFTLLFSLMALKTNSETISQYPSQDQQQITYSDEQCRELLSQREYYENALDIGDELSRITNDYDISDPNLEGELKTDRTTEQRKLDNINSQLQQHCPGY